MASSRERHDRIDHVIVIFFKCFDGLGSCAVSVVNDHANVLLTYSLSINILVISSSSCLSWLSLCSSCRGCSCSSLSLSLHSLGLLHVNAVNWVINSDLSKDGELVTILSRSHDSWIIDHKDQSVLLLKSNTGDSLKVLHTKLGQGLASLLLLLADLLSI